MNRGSTAEVAAGGVAETGSQRRFLGVGKEVLAISAVRLCDALGNSILFVVLPLFFLEFHDASAPLPAVAMVGVLISVFAFVAALAQPFVGWLSDKLARRKVFILAGLGLLAVSTYGFTMASGFWDLVFLRCLQGVGVALTLPTSFALISIYSSRENRGTAMAVFTAARTLGLALGPLMGGFMLLALGFNYSFAIAAALILAGAVLFGFLVRDKRPRDPDGARPDPRTFRILFARRGLLTLGFVNVVMATAIILLIPLEHQMNQRLGQTAAEFGIAISALLFASLVFQLPVGRLADRIGRKPLILFGLLLLCPTTMALGWVSSSIELIAVRIFQGMAFAAIAPVSFALAADLAPRGAEGKQMSILSAAFGIGLGIGPLLAGGLAGFFFYELPFYVGGLLALAASVVVSLRVPESLQAVGDSPAGVPEAAR